MDDESKKINLSKTENEPAVSNVDKGETNIVPDSDELVVDTTKGKSKVNTKALVLIVIVLLVIFVGGFGTGIFTYMSDNSSSYLDLIGVSEDASILSNEFVSSFYSAIKVKDGKDATTLVVPDLATIYENHRDDLDFVDDEALSELLIEHMSEASVEIEYTDDAVSQVIDDFLSKVLEDVDSVSVDVEITLPNS